MNLRRRTLAGDAVHLVIPTGGLGMNTAVGDVVDLGWKLAAVLQGWGGPGLLDSYEEERRRVGLFNVAASGWAAEGLRIWSSHDSPDLKRTDEAGMRARIQLRELADIYHRRVHDMVGAELGYHYANSTIVIAEDGPEPAWDVRAYVPSAYPGARLPHMWLEDGTPIFDALGPWYTVLALSDHVDGADIAKAGIDLNIPVDLKVIPDARLRQVYGARLLIIRPDIHVAWRGWAPPANLAATWRTVTGHDADA